MPFVPATIAAASISAINFFMCFFISLILLSFYDLCVCICTLISFC